MADPVFDPGRPFEDAVSPTFDPSKPFDEAGGVTVGGLAKQLGAGLADTGIATLGSLGDIRQFASGAAEKLGLDPRVGQAALRSIPIAGQLASFLPAPTSKQVGEFVGAENLPKPGNVSEEYARTIGQFVPTAIGPGGLLRKGAEVVAAGVGSETAGQLARKYVPEWEGAARVAGSLVGSAPGVIRGRPQTYPTEQELRQSAQYFYRHPVVAGVEISPAATNRLADDIVTDLNRAALRDKTAPQAYRTVETLREAVDPATVRIADIDATRQVLGDIAKSQVGTAEARAAGIAIGRIDNFLQNIRQSDLYAGNAQRASELLRMAREDYSAYKRLQRVNNEEYRAQLNAASAHSGTNVDNALRQRIKSILVNEKKSHGFADEELNLMERIVTGTLPQNVMRRIAKIASPTGLMGMHWLVAATGLMMSTGSPMGFVAPAIGGAARLIENALSRRNLTAAQEAVSMRSRLGRVTPIVQSERPQSVGASLARAMIARRERELGGE